MEGIFFQLICEFNNSKEKLTDQNEVGSKLLTLNREHRLQQYQGHQENMRVKEDVCSVILGDEIFDLHTR